MSCPWSTSLTLSLMSFSSGASSNMKPCEMPHCDRMLLVPAADTLLHLDFYFFYFFFDLPPLIELEFD